MAEITSSYLTQTPREFLVMDYSFSGLKIVATRGHVAEDGLKRSEIIHSKYYDTGVQIHISAIYNAIHKQLKEKLPALKIDQQLCDTIRSQSFEAFKGFSHSKTKRIPAAVFGTDIFLERDNILDFSSLENALQDFSVTLEPLTTPESALQVILIGSACFDQNFQQIVSQKFPNMNLIMLNDPTRARVRASARLVRNLELSRPHQIKFDSAEYQLEVSALGENFNNSQMITYTKVFPSKFHFELEAPSLTQLSYTSSAELLASCTVDSNSNTTETYLLEFSMQPDLVPQLEKISVGSTSTCNFLFGYFIAQI